MVQIINAIRVCRAVACYAKFTINNLLIAVSSVVTRIANIPVPAIARQIRIFLKTSSGGDIVSDMCKAFVQIIAACSCCDCRCRSDTLYTSLCCCWIANSALLEVYFCVTVLLRVQRVNQRRKFLIQVSHLRFQYKFCKMILVVDNKKFPPEWDDSDNLSW